jgi:hypothetical protein
MEIIGEVLPLKELIMSDFVFPLLACVVGIFPLSTEFTYAFVHL